MEKREEQWSLVFVLVCKEVGKNYNMICYFFYCFIIVCAWQYPVFVHILWFVITSPKLSLECMLYFTCIWHGAMYHFPRHTGANEGVLDLVETLNAIHLKYWICCSFRRMAWGFHIGFYTPMRLLLATDRAYEKGDDSFSGHETITPLCWFLDFIWFLFFLLILDLI